MNDWYLQLIEALVEAGKNRTMPQLSFALKTRVERILQDYDIQNTVVLNWRPSLDDYAKLMDAKKSLTLYLHSSGEKRNQWNNDLQTALAGRNKQWQALRKLKDEFFRQLRSGTSVITPISAINDFASDAEYLTIYIDETWPQEANAERPSMGVIAGLVWQGKDIDHKELPCIATHLRQVENFFNLAESAIHNLYDCKRCFPFIMPFENTERQTQHALYEPILRQALALLLGWLLPPRRRKTRVAVRLEQFTNYSEGRDETETMRGFLSGLALQNPSRFGNWEFDLVRWEGKDFEYIPYADLLGYLTHDTSKALKIADRVNYQELPGYLPLSLDLVPQLNRLEQLDHGNVNSVLECALKLSGTRLYEVLMRDVTRRLQSRPDLQNRLLQLLEERYQAKQRNLRELRSQFKAVRRLIPDVPDSSGMHVRLLWIVMGLQNANHDGDPQRAAELAGEYRQIRDQAIQQDREFCVYLDLNLAVHYADRFEFKTAFDIIDQWSTDTHFEVLPVLSRGRIHSSKGQYLSMLGRTPEAEQEFIDALALLECADIPLTARQEELDQTRVYRAINALDDSDADAVRAVRDVLGEGFDEAARLLAQSEPGERLYHHHLLLRCLYYRPELERERQAYLDQRTVWQKDIQHPWPLIMLYRGLLLWQDEEPAAVEWFDHAIEAAEQAPHGATLRLIGAMITTIACCCYNDSEAVAEIQERTLGKLNLLSPDLPGAGPTIKRLRAILQNPGPESVDDALRALPFNYH